MYPSEKLTRVSDMTRKMVGEPNDPKPKTKGAETYGIVLFVCMFLRARWNMLDPDGQRLCAAGEILIDIVKAFEKHGFKIDAVATQDRKGAPNF